MSSTMTRTTEDDDDSTEHAVAFESGATVEPAEELEKVDLRQFDTIEDYAAHVGVDVEVAEENVETTGEYLEWREDPVATEHDATPTEHESGVQDSPTTCIWNPPRVRDDDPRSSKLAKGPLEADVFTVDGHELKSNIETTIGPHVVDWLRMSGVTLHQATEFARVSAQNPDAERTLWAKLTTDRTETYREIVRALVHAYDGHKKGERESATLTYDDLEDAMAEPISRPKLSKRVKELCEGGVAERGGMPTRVGFVSDDVATLATITLAKTDPHHRE